MPKIKRFLRVSSCDAADAWNGQKKVIRGTPDRRGANRIVDVVIESGELRLKHFERCPQTLLDKRSARLA